MRIGHVLHSTVDGSSAAYRELRARTLRAVVAEDGMSTAEYSAV
ncbi:hypothetical protein [Nocardia brasiliensis]|nr:hypothetical protein [Nocardia brasiliensis]